MRVENQPMSRNDSLVVAWIGCQRKALARGGRGVGASWKMHQRIVKRLVGGRKRVEVGGERVPVEKDTNEMQ